VTRLTETYTIAGRCHGIEDHEDPAGRHYLPDDYRAGTRLRYVVWRSGTELGQAATPEEARALLLEMAKKLVAAESELMSRLAEQLAGDLVRLCGAEGLAGFRDGGTGAAGKVTSDAGPPAEGRGRRAPKSSPADSQPTAATPAAGRGPAPGAGEVPADAPAGSRTRRSRRG